MTLVLFGLWLMAIFGGYCLGWWWRGRRERQLDREALERISEDQRAVSSGVDPHRPEAVQSAMYPGSLTQTRWQDDKERRGLAREIPYEEQAPMFMDQFLLRYFYELVKPIDFTAKGRPWELFVQKNPWAKEMPVLFHQLTSIQLTDMQLNGAVADYMSRLSKLEGSQRS